MSDFQYEYVQLLCQLGSGPGSLTALATCLLQQSLLGAQVLRGISKLERDLRSRLAEIDSWT